jgi:L-ascorbate metabolism protein UlaG (beta-lactamase superfamily)
MADLPDGTKITWLGHATFVIESKSGRFLIDPWLANNPSCPDDMKDPGKLDSIFITHAHFDHISDVFDVEGNADHIVGIAETVSWLGSKGISEDKLIGYNKGGTVEAGGVRAHMTHAVHSCGITDGDQTIYGGEAAGYVFELQDGFRIYHAGDTAVFSDMELIGRLLEPDIAILPIGDHFTMGPNSAAEAIRLLGVKTVIPCHWGTFPMLTGTPDALREAAKDVDGLEVVNLEPGQTLG